MVTRRVIQTYKTLPGRHHEAEVECPNDSAQLTGFSIRHWYKEEWVEHPQYGRRKEHVEYTTITAHWVIKNWAD